MGMGQTVKNTIKTINILPIRGKCYKENLEQSKAWAMQKGCIRQNVQRNPLLAANISAATYMKNFNRSWIQNIMANS